MSFIAEFFGYIALITSLIGLAPQVYKTYKTKSAWDLSMVMLVNYVICSFAWIVHGFLEQSFFVVASNIAGLVISLISVLQKIYYDAKNKS
jgi:MtN3 and saliva related transmembrane protein